MRERIEPRCECGTQESDNRKNLRTSADDKYELTEFPEYVVIDITYACNVVCKMCHLYSPTFKIPKNPHVSFDLIKTMIPLLQKSKSAFLLGYGEPLMHPKIYDIVSLIKTECPNTWLSFASNGILLNQRNIDKLIDARLDQINISIDGPDLERGHPKIDLAYASVRRLAAEKKRRGITYPQIHIAFVIGKDNENALLSVLKFGIEVEISRIAIEPMRILASIPEWDGYITENNVYNHLDTIVPIMQNVKALAEKHSIEVYTPIPLAVAQTTGVSSMPAERIEPSKQIDQRSNPFSGASTGRKCDRPFRMFRVEMDGTVYMCPAVQRANLNVFDADPIKIWNSDRFKEIRYQLDAEEYDSTCLDCHILRNKLTSDAEAEKIKVRPLDYRIIGNVLLDPRHQPVETNNQIDGWVESVEQAPKSLTLTGWAADLKAGRPCKFIIVFINDIARGVGRSTLRRPDVATNFSRPRIETSGYSISICDDGQLAASNIRIRVFALDGVGNARELRYLTQDGKTLPSHICVGEGREWRNSKAYSAIRRAIGGLRLRLTRPTRASDYSPSPSRHPRTPARPSP